MPPDEPWNVEPIDEVTPPVPPQMTPDYRSNMPEFLGIRPWVANLILLAGLIAGTGGFVLLGAYLLTSGDENGITLFLVLLFTSIVIGGVLFGLLLARSLERGRTVWGSLLVGLTSSGLAVICLAVGLVLLLIGYCFVTVAHS